MLTAIDLRCEYGRDPLGIDRPEPRLSWALETDRRADKQTAYQLIVASTKELLSPETADLWNSGKVESTRSPYATYGGKKLSSGQRCWWTVRTWDNSGNPCSWAEPAFWEMGLLHTSDWNGKWINDGRPLPERDEDFYKEEPAPLFRKDFSTSKKIKHARLYITAAGYYEASINGLRIGDKVLDPGWTNYRKRIFYSTYDVTTALGNGPNCIGVALGNGWYNPLPLRLWSHLNLRERLPIGRPAFMAQLIIEYVDGTRVSVASDKTWKWSESPILRNNIYIGEVYDARREIQGWNTADFDASTWRFASQAPEPGGILQSQFLPPIRTTATIKPAAITSPGKGIYIVDMGRNFAGGVRIQFNEPAGTRIIMRYGELLYADGTLNPMTSTCGQIKGRNKDGTNKGGPGSPETAWQEDVYIARGEKGETYIPTFTWHAFRYMEVTGCTTQPDLKSITGLRQNSDLEKVGSFSCSNDLFNKIEEITENTFLSNVFSVQSDCPHRERFGYGGDLVATSDAFIASFDMAGFYCKSVRDWADTAEDDGRLMDTAPSVGMKYCQLAWAMAHPVLLQQLYKYYGNIDLVREQYDVAAKWMRMIQETYPGHIIDKGLHDHEALEKGTTPEMVTPLYHQCAMIMSGLAGILAKDDEAAAYRDLAGRIAKAYRNNFVEAGSGVFKPGIQASQAFAIYSGLADDSNMTAALDYLVNDVTKKHNGHLTTGILGTKYLLDVLSEHGRADVAYDMVNKRDFPGWGHMIEQGATTLWETWKFSDNTYSHNHPMFGSVSEWFYKHAAGISVDKDSIGCDRLTINPKLTDKLDWAKASYKSVRGLVECNWRRDGTKLEVSITIPVGATAAIHLPAETPDRVSEGGTTASEASGIHYEGLIAGKSVFRAASGNYRFSINHVHIAQP